MRRALAVVSFAFFLHGAASPQQPQAPYSGNEATVVAGVLDNARTVGSIEFKGECRPGIFFPDFPKIQLPPRPYPQDPVETFRFMFASHPQIEVSRDSKGMIRIVESGVRPDILQVRINHLSFDGPALSEDAFDTVVEAPEVQSFIQAHDIGQPYDITGGPPLLRSSGLKATPQPGTPKVSGELNNVTLADALDYILKAHPGFWLYQDCESSSGQRLVYFGLFPVPGRIWLWTSMGTRVR
jgi:hypothetical protein